MLLSNALAWSSTFIGGTDYDMAFSGVMASLVSLASVWVLVNMGMERRREGVHA